MLARLFLQPHPELLLGMKGFTFLSLNWEVALGLLSQAFSSPVTQRRQGVTGTLCPGHLPDAARIGLPLHSQHCSFPLFYF